MLFRQARAVWSIGTVMEKMTLIGSTVSSRLLKKPFHMREPQAWAPTLHGLSTT